MSEFSWPWSTVGAVGDGTTTLSEALSREFLALYFGVQDPAVEGVSKGVLNELAVSGIASPVSIATGSAICYGLYRNTAVVTKAISTPAVGTTGFRVVLQTNWAGVGGGLQASTRIAVVKSADGVAAIPALTQVALTTWEISLATGTITTGGVITLTDARNFRKSTAVVGTNELVALAVTTAKIALLNITTALINDLAVTTGKLADLAVTSGKLAALSVIAGKIADGAVDTAARLASNVVTNPKLRQSVRNSVIGRSAATTGDVADITADDDNTVLLRSGGILGFGEVQDEMLRQSVGTSVIGRSAGTTGDVNDIAAENDDVVLLRSGGILGFGQIVTAMLANLAVTSGKLASNAVTAGKIAAGGLSSAAQIADAIITGAKMVAGAIDTAQLADNSVDDTKAGNRVPQFYRRQGGDASDWSVQGSTNRTPTSVRMQAGVIRWTGAAANAGSVAVAFPVAFSNKPIVFVTSTADLVLALAIAAGISAIGLTIDWYDPGSTHTAIDINWLAIGSE